jgi:hypothetical protein
VKGKLRLNNPPPIRVGDLVFQFHTNESGRVTSITATVPANAPEDVSTVQIAPGGPIKAHINVAAPRWDAVRSSLRTIEGLLSLHGVDEITLGQSEQSWVAETKQEQALLAMHSFAVEVSERPDGDFPVVPFDIVARSVLASTQALDTQIPLSFFRKGQIDIHDERFIEAFYDFFFVLETLFGNGKSKSRALLSEFVARPTLIEAVRESLADPFLVTYAAAHSRVAERFAEVYRDKAPEEVLEALISTRGLLHHHSLKSSKPWHPDDHHAFEIDAIVIQQIAFKVAWGVAAAQVFSDYSLEQYQRQFQRQRGS